MTQPPLQLLLEQLTLEEKVLLLTGRDIWTTHPLPSIGLRSIVMSDGPSGVRGQDWDERHPSLNLPSAAVLSSSWDTAVARRYGQVLGVEAHRKNVDVVLGPTVNLHRTPFGGRSFESFSEDPVLTGAIAGAYIEGLQSNGVAATVKHYVANDSETERFTVDARVDERTLRELYLAPFETAVVDAHSWALMSAYNSVNGATMSESRLLEDPLSTDWGFDGLVISDWTAVRTLDSAAAFQDLVMPGPAGPWGDALVAAVREGVIDEDVVDRKVLRILQLAARVGALTIPGAPAVEQGSHVEDGIAFARESAAAGSVLLENRGDVLPLDPAQKTHIAVIGHSAQIVRTQGGGSATVIPTSTVSPLDGIRAVVGEDAVEYATGAIAEKGILPIPPHRMQNPATGTNGAHVRYIDAYGVELAQEDRLASSFVWFGTALPIARTHTIEVTTTYMPDSSGPKMVGFAAAGTVRIFVDGVIAVDATLTTGGSDPGVALLAPPTYAVPFDFIKGRETEIRVEFELGERSGPMADAAALTFGFEPGNTHPEQLLEQAVAAAARADVAVVVVGTNSVVESEGYDRATLSLPGDQDRLVSAVAAANPRTIVVVNSGAPVLMPWRNQVAAIVVNYFGGQETGNALADLLFGAVEPGGRLPTTWPDTETDVPVRDVTPKDGVLKYTEGLNIGYRAWLKHDSSPAYEFGFGLGYTTWALADCTVAPSADGEAFEVTVSVENTGMRRGKQVVQVYAERGKSSIDRPIRWLVGFSAVQADAGDTVQATVTVPSRLLAYWDSGWHYEPGAYALRVGLSSINLPLTAQVVLGETNSLIVEGEK